MQLVNSKAQSRNNANSRNNDNSRNFVAEPPLATWKVFWNYLLL